MNKKEQTIDTYNKSAIPLAKKFDAIGARKSDIKKVFSLSKKTNPFVLEVGCGNGRDAKEIIKHTTNYLGIDISEKLLEIAKKNLPNINLRQADIEFFSFPKNIHIIFAFASLIHVPKERFIEIMKRIHKALADDGIVFISLKHSPTYTEITKEDEFGIRTYWHYSESDIHKIAKGFIILETIIQEINNQKWVDVILKKQK